MKLLHVASALALGLTLVVTTPITLGAPVQTKAADTTVVNTHQAPNPVAKYRGNFAAAQRAMADWTRFTALPYAAGASNIAGEQTSKADPPPVTTVPGPTNAGNIAAAQRAMADWTHVTPLPDATKADNIAAR
ncbi:MAG: hypothetical protein ACREPS_05745 [Rhodanobacteraceae bacterium]